MSHATATNDATTASHAPTHRAAARGYNQLVFEGRLVEDPALRQAGTGRLYCRVMVVQDQPDRNGQSGTQGVDVVCFDERASRFAGRFRRGDYAIFIGRMTIERRRDQKGQLHTNVSLHLERVLGHRPMRR
jgi:single-stranded DNA-binding protein